MTLIILAILSAMNPLMFNLSDMFDIKVIILLLSRLLAVKRDIAISIFVQCMCASVRIFRPITSALMHGFQNNLAQLLSLRRKKAV